MSWSRKLSEPIVLDDGRTFTRLCDTVDYMVDLSERKKTDPAWQYAVRLMRKAAEPEATAADLSKAERQIVTCLRRDGVMGINGNKERSQSRWRHICDL